jgi:signal transduction histidine kinase
MAKEIVRKDEHLKEIFNRKLEELAFTGAAVAHEIRNPLSAIEMHFGLLRRRLQKSDLVGTEVAEIAEQLLHLRKLVESFLNYSRRVVPEREKIDLNAFFDQFLKLRRGIWPGLECTTDFEEPAVILFDRTMLQQICENIFANAVAAAETITLNIGFKRCERGWSLIFANDGPQIQAEMLEKLFTPFITARSGGNGIGLALVRKLVEANGGEIVCRNDATGVVFTIEVEEK